MATIVQPPFVVPRPADDFSWVNPPTGPFTGNLPPTVTFFGQAGQASPRWPWNFGLDDASGWQGTPASSQLLAPLLTAAGKVPPRWAWNFAYDDHPAWQPFAFARNVELFVVIPQPFLNPPYQFGLEESAIWQLGPIRVNAQLYPPPAIASIIVSQQIILM